MSEIISHKESLYVTISDIIKQNSGLAIGIMNIDIGKNEDGSERFEVRISDQFESELMALLPQAYKDFSIKYERISQPNFLETEVHSLEVDEAFDVATDAAVVAYWNALPEHMRAAIYEYVKNETETTFSSHDVYKFLGPLEELVGSYNYLPFVLASEGKTLESNPTNTKAERETS